MPSHIGIVAIGRNEGERLKECLASLANLQSPTCSDAPARPAAPPCGFPVPVIYVDSGSTDGSVEMARHAGATVIELDTERPFSAARARNAGLAAILEQMPAVDYVQFLDGDCRMVPGWVDAAARFLAENTTYAVVCGRRRERFPEHSIYNRLCDMEWDTPLGDNRACGGDAMMRVSALRQAGLFDPSIIAGEEPELCFRLREKHWKVRRLDHDMTLHDAAITRFGQWWKRSVRAGYAYATAVGMHGDAAEPYWVREYRSNWGWGVLLPLAIMSLLWVTSGISIILCLGFAVLFWRVKRHGVEIGRKPQDARLYALFCVLGKFPQALGQTRYWWNRLAAKPGVVIEYKAHVSHGAVCPESAPS